MKQLFSNIWNNETLHIFLSMTFLELMMLSVTLSIWDINQELVLMAGLEQVLLVFEG